MPTFDQIGVRPNKATLRMASLLESFEYMEEKESYNGFNVNFRQFTECESELTLTCRDAVFLSIRWRTYDEHLKDSRNLSSDINLTLEIKSLVSEYLDRYDCESPEFFFWLRMKPFLHDTVERERTHVQSYTQTRVVGAWKHEAIYVGPCDEIQVNWVEYDQPEDSLVYYHRLLEESKDLLGSEGDHGSMKVDHENRIVTLLWKDVPAFRFALQPTYIPFEAIQPQAIDLETWKSTWVALMDKRINYLGTDPGVKMPLSAILKRLEERKFVCTELRNVRDSNGHWVEAELSSPEGFRATISGNPCVPR